MEKKKRDKKYNPQKSQKDLPIIAIMKDLFYGFKKRGVIAGDVENLLVGYQHLYFLQSISRDTKYKLVSLENLNKCKNAIRVILDIIVEQNLTLVNDEYFGNKDLKVFVSKKLINRVMWYMKKLYIVTLQAFSLGIQYPKHIIEARKMMSLDVLMKNTQLAPFIEWSIML